MAMAFSTSSPPSPPKTTFTLTTLLFFLLFLFSLFLFSKQALEPSISLYRDFFSQTPSSPSSSSSSSPPLTRSGSRLSLPDDANPPLERVDSPINQPLSPNPQIQLKDSQTIPSSSSSPPSSLTHIDSHLSLPDDPNPPPERVGSPINKPISPNPQIQLEDSETSAESVNADLPADDEENTVPVNGDGEEMGDKGGGDLVSEELKKCDLYMGTWVKDEDYPIYKPSSCPYVDEAFDCQSNGRRDSDYLKWRWKPDGCDLPRFNATDFLVRLRGKKLMLVGDSMNRNQFESILCLLREGLPDKSRMREVHGHKITKGRGYYVFKFQDYNCSLVFVRSHFLVKEGVRINAQGNSNPTLSIDQIDKTSGRWKRADILVFNTGHWWAHGKTARGKNYYKEGDYLYPEFDSVEAYRRALKTWANWIDKNVNPAKQLVFYRGYSSAHFRGGDWDSGGSCNGETEPVLSGTILNNYPLKMKIVEEVIKDMQVPVILLNVTRLTNFRKDGHPSIYGKNITAGKKVSTRRQDCSHWCVPGVPDTWNELIYASLVYQQTNSKMKIH